MSPSEYLDALEAAGISRRLPLGELDRRAAALLGIDIRTARRYRRGERRVLAPVQIALRALATNRGRKENLL